MTTSPQAADFFAYWIDACKQRHDTLFSDWTRSSFFTAHVFTEPGNIIDDIAGRMGLRAYCGYYSIDAVLFKDDDFVPDRPGGTTWIRRIRIAFEHENNFYSDLFQEVSHLLITDCDLRVVVSYPGNRDDLENELKHLHSIIADTDRSAHIAATESFLFIAGWRHVEQGTIEWWGYVYEQTQWRRL